MRSGRRDGAKPGREYAKTTETTVDKERAADKERTKKQIRERKKNMEELLEILRDLHPEVDFETCENLIDAGIQDSFDIVSVIAEIGERFDVTISAEKIVPENFNSAKALYHLIQELEDED